jgi:hypothetical protein
MRTKQAGLTFIGFIMLLIVVGFFAYAAMKLVPVYTEYMGVVKSMNLIATESGSATKSVDELRRDLRVKFDAQFVNPDTIPAQNIQLKRQGGAATLRIFYERRVTFIYNVDLLVHFDKSVDMRANF